MNFFSISPFILQTIFWPFAWVIFHFFGKVRIVGKENLRGYKSGAIFAVNHISELDPILIPATLNPFSTLMPMFYLARERSFYPRAQKGGLVQYMYGGNFFEIWGAYPVTVGIRDYEQALRHHIDILERGMSVCIFPEGRRNRDGKVGEGKVGVAYLLWRTGRPVIPVAIRGHYQMTPRAFFTRKHTITVEYGRPITREELFGTATNHAVPPSQESLKAATHTIMSRIRGDV